VVNGSFDELLVGDGTVTIDIVGVEQFLAEVLVSIRLVLDYLEHVKIFEA